MIKMPKDVFRLAVTCIICKITPKGKRRYLILKRSPKERHGSAMWGVAGGTVEEKDWKDSKQDYTFPLWYDVSIRALKREVEEETGLIISNPTYFCDCVFIHKTSVPEMVLSFYALFPENKFIGIRLSKEHTDYAWVKVSELDNYNLLIDIPMEIRAIDKIIYENMMRLYLV